MSRKRREFEKYSQLTGARLCHRSSVVPLKCSVVYTYSGDMLWFFDCALFRQRMGDELNDLDLDELRGLEQKMDDSLAIIRERKEEKCEVDPQYGLGEYKGDYESVVAFANGMTNLYSFRLAAPDPLWSYPWKWQISVP
ncbi:hypothetical protein LguiB_006290 [Lonicera macranthoides]